MAPFTLFIGNKNYSSWSLRAWLVMMQVQTPFDEVMIPLNEPGIPTVGIRPHSPSGRVPALRHGDITIWDSLAIGEYLAEVFPEVGLWPEDRATRAIARAVSAEMHSSFNALRAAMPMNLRRTPVKLAQSTAVAEDVARILTLWRDCRQRHERSGPFLFGRFSVADAMYAPVVSRFRTYLVDVDAVSRAYMEAVTTHPSMRAAYDAAMTEGHPISYYDRVGL